MRYQILFLFISSIFLISCGGTNETPNKNTNITNATVPNKANTNSPLGTTKTPEAAKTGEAPNISPVVQGYYEALKKKDEADAKKFLSAAAVKYYEEESRKEKKTLLAFVTEENDPVDEKREVRNENISGNIAVVEMKGGSLGDWAKITFVKENGEWKFASPTESIKNSGVKQTETLPTPAK
jgi:hypothetical protein